MSERGPATPPGVKHLCPVCGDEYINVGYHAEACTGTRVTAGVLADFSATAYHSDEVAGQPSLSASIAAILCNQSPLHAWTQHPRLNPNFERKEDDKFSVGNAAHAVILEGRDIVEPLAMPDWRTNAAKELREQARADGKIPLLIDQWQEVQEMVAAVHAQLGTHAADPPLFVNGKPEQTLVWSEDGVQCRARLDWFHDDLKACDDLKTTSRSANPDAYSRALFSVGGDVQAAFYLRGIRAVTGADPEFRWCVVETTPPFALSVISPGPDVLALGDAKVEYALSVWRRCLASGEWPGYPTRVCYAEAPAWEDTRWLEKTTREEAA